MCQFFQPFPLLMDAYFDSSYWLLQSIAVNIYYIRTLSLWLSWYMYQVVGSLGQKGNDLYLLGVQKRISHNYTSPHPRSNLVPKDGKFFILFSIWVEPPILYPLYYCFDVD